MKIKQFYKYKKFDFLSKTLIILLLFNSKFNYYIYLLNTNKNLLIHQLISLSSLILCSLSHFILNAPGNERKNIAD